MDCKRSDGETAEDYYCVGERPHETEACVMEAFVIMSVANGRCLGPKDGATAGEGTVVRRAALSPPGPLRGSPSSVPFRTFILDGTRTDFVD